MTLLYLLTSAMVLRSLKIGEVGTRPAVHLIRMAATIHLGLLLYHGATLSQIHQTDLCEGLGFGMLLMLAVVSRRNSPPKLSYLVLPAAIVAIAMSELWVPQALLQKSWSARAPWIYAHIGLALVGYAAFAILALGGALYLWQNSLLKRRAASIWSPYCPDLVQLEHIQTRGLYYGLLVFTLAIASGKWSFRILELSPRWNPQEILSLCVWSLFALLVLMRRIPSLRKHITAYGSLAGLALIALTFVALKLVYVDDIHHFGSGP